MELQVSGSAGDPAETVNENLEQKTNVFMMPTPGSGSEESATGSEPGIQEEDFSAAVDHFSHLSSDLTEVLLDLSRMVRILAEQLKRIQSLLDGKKSELKRLEAQINSERRAWEEEKMIRLQQEREYATNLEAQRQREAEEYRQTWDSERAKAQQQLQEELRLIQQETRLKQEAFEQDCQKRERALKEKERECVQLAHELEQFMSRLSNRIQPRP